MTSGRPPWVTSSRSGLAISLTPRSDRTVPAAPRMFSWMEATVVVLGPVVDVAEQPEEAEHQRRQRQQGEERRLGREAEDRGTRCTS